MTLARLFWLRHGCRNDVAITEKTAVRQGSCMPSVFKQGNYVIPGKIHTFIFLCRGLLMSSLHESLVF